MAGHGAAGLHRGQAAKATRAAPKTDIGQGSPCPIILFNWQV